MCLKVKIKGVKHFLLADGIIVYGENLRILKNKYKN